VDEERMRPDPLVGFSVLSSFSAFTLFVGGQEGNPARETTSNAGSPGKRSLKRKRGIK